MLGLQKGAIRLFRLFGIEVSLHWSWLLVGAYEVISRQIAYRSLGWNIGEYLALFAIVLAHEFGHALACRSVGGRAERIILWPLGGVAFVSPPARPGAVLWSIAAGPLVNLILLPLCVAGSFAAHAATGNPDVGQFFYRLAAINLVLLVFNLLPIYPLDGGQILQAILWFAIGRIRALRVAATIGLVATLGALGVALFAGQTWFVVLALFGALRAWNGLRQANAAARLESAPRRVELRCPLCGTPPPVGEFWNCPCKNRFDPFATAGVCPRCSTQHRHAACVACQRPTELRDWVVEATSATDRR